MIQMKQEISNTFGKMFLTLEYDDFHHWLVSAWMGYLTVENVIEGGNACIDALKANNCHYLLNDNRQVVGPWNHAVEWIVHDWTPRAFASGLTHIAHVVADTDSLAAISAAMMQPKVNSSFKMRIFCNQEEAVNWLREAQKNAMVSG